MLTVTTTRFASDIEDYIIQEKTVCLFGWVVYRWQERFAQRQPTD
jgi:hypothetical protein